MDRRRMLVRGGAAAAPVVLTLASQPVSATGLIGCTKASGFVSMNTFASQQPGVNFIQCASNGVSFWRTQAASWRSGVSSSTPYYTQMQKTVATYLSASGCVSGTSRVGAILQLALDNAGDNGVLQRMLALGLSINYGMVTNSNNVSPAYLGQVWLNYHANGRRYMTGVANESMDAAALIKWLDLLTTASPIVNTAA
jgi:hypothetical protein